MKPIHKHFILRAEIKHPPKEKDMQRISNWMFFLVKDIGMKILFGLCSVVKVVILISFIHIGERSLQ